MYGKDGVDGGASTSADDGAELFEAMFGMGPKKARGVPGGVMFVNERREFFQRRFDAEKIESMREEMAGLPELHVRECGTYAFESSTTLPVGPWEVRFVEVDEEASSVTVTFGAGDKGADGEADEAWQ